MTATEPAQIHDFAEQAVAYVQRALGVKLEYDSDTLPVLDHYLRSVPSEKREAMQLVLETAGAYFGEVVRRRLGGRWDKAEDGQWRMVLPTGIHFSPIGFVASAIAQGDLEDLDTELDAPPRMLPHLQQALSRMGELTVEEYYSLCGRLDTLEHVHEVLVAVAAGMLGDVEGEGEGEGDDAAGGGEVHAAVHDEPSDGVN